MKLKGKIKKYLKAANENKMMIAQLAVMGAIAVNSGNHQAFAALGGDMGQFSFISKGVTQIANVVTGPMAAAVAVVGAGMLGYGTLTDSGNSQLMKKGGGFMAGTGLMAGSYKLYEAMASSVGGAAGSGFLF